MPIFTFVSIFAPRENFLCCIAGGDIGKIEFRIQLLTRQPVFLSNSDSCSANKGCSVMLHGTLVIFLAAMSSSRSEVDTQFVRPFVLPFVCPFFFSFSVLRVCRTFGMSYNLS